MLFFKKKVWLSWKEYSRKIRFLDMFNFQQSVRKENIKNS